MKIGINATAAFKRQRTGVEGYVYHLLEAMAKLREPIKGPNFILYKDRRDKNSLGFSFPNQFKIKELYAPVAWTQVRLAVEMILNKPDVLFVPVHVLPRFHPEKSIVTIHGLEYEYYPRHYSASFLRYIRRTTKYAAQKASQIIAVSQATKKDLEKFYKIKPDKISVVHHGASLPRLKINFKNEKEGQPFLLYLGRIELKKNIIGIIESFRILKERHKIPHRLILAGAPGFGYKKIKQEIEKCCLDIEETGFIDENTKQKLLSRADVFLFPSLYEGFGLPILEAQAVGTPVITSNLSSMPEVAGQGALLVNPKEPEEIAQSVYSLIKNKEQRNLIIDRGFDNIKRFSWGRCAKETLEVLTK